ncbi:hypothetical protein [Paracoccus endophyticus]|uniref:hypothetical protein n=1 Tax=Paracoccus endophyticus TaxID=2233774 RepID=UPI0013A6C9B1|nr:hypothetical protein [Paracoccus endophyticus]
MELCPIPGRGRHRHGTPWRAGHGPITATGSRIEADHLVDAAGAWAKDIRAMLGLYVPIEPLRRSEHYVECEESIKPLPHLKDPERQRTRSSG